MIASASASSSASAPASAIERCIAEAGERLRASGEPYLIATVVSVHGSAYRRPGARMLIARDRWIAGSVSGGCLEGDLQRKAWWRTQGGAPALVSYDSRVDDDAADDDLRAAFAVGCNGVVEVLIERAAAGRVDPLAIASACLRDQQRGRVAVVFRCAADPTVVGARAALGPDGARHVDPELGARPELLAWLDQELAAGGTRVAQHAGVAAFVEELVPPPRLCVFGAGPDAVPVVAFARALGWEVLVCAPHARPSDRDRFAAADGIAYGAPAELVARVDAADRALAVAMAHDLDLDRAHLQALVGSRALYIGALGPRARTQQMLGAAIGDPRVHAPLGLALGAETPAEIALAAVAEMQACLARAPADRLRDHAGPIHTRPARADAELPADAPRERVACSA